MPSNEIIFRPKPAQEDKRGVIVNFLRYSVEDQGFKIPDLPKTIPDDTFVEVAYISFLHAGDVRANHYHPNGLHQFVYCVAGTYESYSQKLKINKDGTVQADGKIQRIIVRAGDIVFTPSMVAHAMKTLEPNTVIINLNPRLRTKEDYYTGEQPHTLPFKLI